jgi:hypothetical protein
LALLADDDLGRGREQADGPLPAVYLEAFGEIVRYARNELVVMEEAGRVMATLQLTFVPSLAHQGENGPGWRAYGWRRATAEGVRAACSSIGS